ncbi:MAG: hypothetical protein OER88_06185, partial [Planctomycetota bacterium]|nr:hypothetical protein [Planctomycetota bacterium]
MPGKVRRGRFRAALCICSLAFGGVLWAQRFPVRVYTERDGLPSSAIRDLTQMDDGRLVVSTRSGLTIYDGVDWTQLPVTGVPYEFKRIRLDSEGTLWGLAPRHRESVVQRWIGEAWEALPPIPGEWSADWLEDLAIVGAGSDRRVAISGVHGRLAVHQSSTGWIERRLPGDDTLAAYPLAVLEETLYLGTPEGLFRLNANGPGLEPAPGGPGTAVHALATDRHGRLWYATDRTVGVHGEPDPRYRIDRTRLGLHRRGLRLIPLSSGDVWLGDSETLYQLVSDVAPSKLDVRNGLAASGVTALLEDREGLLWVGSDRGLSKVVDRRFRTFDREHGLFEREVTAILRRSDGTTVLGHPGGLTLWKGERLRTLPLPRIPDGTSDVGRVLALAEDERGDVWIAADDRGLMKLDRSDRIVAFAHPEPVERGALEPLRMRGWSVTEVARASSGAVWFADHRGLYRIRNGR